MYSLIKRPSAWIPVLIPLVFFIYIIISITFFALVRENDEGTLAHLFQLWLVLEPFLLGFFTFKWFSKLRKQTLVILMIQIVVAFLPIYMVFSLKL